MQITQVIYSLNDISVSSNLAFNHQSSKFIILSAKFTFKQLTTRKYEKMSEILIWNFD